MSKIISLIITDIKIIIRSNRLYFIISIEMFFIWFMAITIINIVPFILNVLIFMIFLSFQNIFNSMIIREKNDFILINIINHAIYRIILIRNVSIMIITTATVSIMGSMLLILLQLPIKMISEFVLYYFYILFIFMLLGNYLSLKNSECNNTKLSDLIVISVMNNVIFIVATALYLFFKEIDKKYEYIMVTLSLLLYLQNLTKNKHDILEKRYKILGL